MTYLSRDTGGRGLEAGVTGSGKVKCGREVEGCPGRDVHGGVLEVTITWGLHLVRPSGSSL